VEFAVFYFILCIGIAIGANSRGRSAIGWFLLSLLISPLLSLIFLALASNLKAEAVTKAGQPSPDTHVKCPDCAELVLNEARVCKHCGCKLIPQA